MLVCFALSCTLEVSGCGRMGGQGKGDATVPSRYAARGESWETIVSMRADGCHRRFARDAMYEWIWRGGDAGTLKAGEAGNEVGKRMTMAVDGLVCQMG